MAQEYRCTNEHCPLGTNGQAGGRFFGGITKETVNLLTGRPIDSLKSGEDYGAGICPNCGKHGEPYDAGAEELEFVEQQIAELRERQKALKS